MNNIRAIAIDDESTALDVIRIHAEKIPFLSLEETFTSPSEAIQYISNHAIDLLILDIEMPDIQGLDFAKLLVKEKLEILLVTAHDKYALQGYEIQAIDYLLKPVSFERFLKACQLVLDKHSKRPSEPFIFVKDGYELVRIQIEDILFIKSDTNLLFIHTASDRTITRMTMTKAMEVLPKEKFIRVHKSYIVPLGKITRLDHQNVYLGDKAIPVSNSYREKLQQAVDQFLWK